ncbi:hypothetical protein L3Q82_002522 [Scortum barcoo]|uniref:Uncharacterized protein n=1 Tax=Scortum barcoo TaxID=214431 RepID=A0ACB8VY58_9TELE|nr:hypothetical protein L3Q82_002522 [Scortum barcoo]
MLPFANIMGSISGITLKWLKYGLLLILSTAVHSLASVLYSGWLSKLPSTRYTGPFMSHGRSCRAGVGQPLDPVCPPPFAPTVALSSASCRPTGGVSPLRPERSYQMRVRGKRLFLRRNQPTSVCCSAHSAPAPPGMAPK